MLSLCCKCCSTQALVAYLFLISVPQKEQEAYKLITKTRVKEEYLLTEKTLKRMSSMSLERPPTSQRGKVVPFLCV